MAGTPNALPVIRTPKARLSYPHLFTPRAMEESGEKRYQCCLIFDKDAQHSPEFKAMQQQALKVGVEKWGADRAKWPKLRYPFRKADEKRLPDGTLPPGYPEGSIFINLSSVQPPSCVLPSMAPASERDLYPGCFVRASVRAFTFEKRGNKGISFGLNNVQKLGEGQPLGGRTTAETDFEPVEATMLDGDTDDPFGGTAKDLDDVPF